MCPCLIIVYHVVLFVRCSTYSGKVFRVTLLSLVAFLLFPLLVLIFLIDSPIQPEAFR